MPTLAVIGTAGRNGTGARLTAAHFEAMCDATRRMCQTLDAPLALVSGGAAWADHVAVTLFLQGHVDRLVLCLPAPWVRGKFSQLARDGVTANKLHQEFHARAHVNGLRDLDEAIRRGATVVVKDGFLARNCEIARHATHMLAFVHGLPVSGGTGHTWSRFGAKGPRTALVIGDLMKPSP